MIDRAGQRGFTLIELLVVVAILALLVGLLLPSLNRAKTLARIAKAHAELRGVTTAITLFREDHDQETPPTRFSCGSRTAYELPIELAPFLPSGRKGGVKAVEMPDPFTGAGYKYRAVGRAIMNEATIIENGATLWIQDDYPHDDGGPGRYHDDPETSPVRYAVWSGGPDPQSEKFDIPGRLPVPGRYWLHNASEDGVIVHFEEADGRIRMSP
jgi:prepilin-type N-terminal cleavage/methylation domain-containing protein